MGRKKSNAGTQELTEEQAAARQEKKEKTKAFNERFDEFLNGEKPADEAKAMVYNLTPFSAKILSAMNKGYSESQIAGAFLAAGQPATEDAIKAVLANLEEKKAKKNAKEKPDEAPLFKEVEGEKIKHRKSEE